MGRFKVGPFPKKQHASTCIFESSVFDMPQKEEDLDVNELIGSNQITKETKILPSNDQDIITTLGSIDNTSFDDG
jgi:hypothetical protein